MAEVSGWYDQVSLAERAAAEWLAVLGLADTTTLAALLSEAPETVLQGLNTRGVIELTSDGWQLTADAHDTVLAALRTEPDRLYALYKQALEHCAQLLALASPQERARAEAAYMRVLEPCCEALIQQQPTALSEVAEAAPLDLLAEVRHRQLVLFYRSLGLGLRESYDAALDGFDALLSDPALDETIRGRALNSGAVFARHQGDYERALEGYQQSQQIWERLGNRARQGLALLNRGVLSYYVQDYAAAERDLYASLSLFRDVEAIHSQGLALMNLGLLGRDLGHWQEALSFFEQAAEMFKQSGAVHFLGMLANNIGEVEMLRGRLEAARLQFEQALAQMTTRAYAVDVHLNLGLLDQAQGDEQEALAHYQTALALADELERREIMALIHYRIGHAQQRLGDLDAARNSYDTAITVIEAKRTPIRDEGLLISLMGRWQLVYEAMIQLCLERGDGAAAFGYTERARARAFADLLARRRTTAHTNATPVSLAEVQTQLPSGTLLLAYFATGLRGPETALLESIPPEAAGLRACLSTPAQLWLIAVTRTSLHWWRCNLNPNVLQASSPYLADGRRFLSPMILRRAYDALVAPAAELLSQAERVVIVPHGPLHQLPFGALLNEAKQPLLEIAPEWSMVPSATMLLQTLMTPVQQAKRPCLALGYDGAAGRRLRFTVAEAQAVAHLCGGEAWQGDAGVVARLREQAHQYRWLHLACHGEFNLDDPLRSWLEVGPDQHLTAAEVINTWELHAELVVLSACRSGVSHVLRGDEPMGLVRAFLSAGARTVLVTLWPVEDSSARLLMERFYNALQSETRGDAAAALQIAQHYLRNLTSSEVRAIWESWGEPDATLVVEDSVRPFADPAFWAAYVLVGSGR